jgi:hypothetical protein
VLINIVAYRMFNSIKTWRECFHFTLNDWSKRRPDIVERLEKAPRPLYRGAYIIKGPLEASIDTIDTIWDHRQWVLECKTVERMTDRLQAFDGVGQFTAHQLAQDLRFGPLKHASDGKTWSTTGPGSHRCLIWLGMKPNLESMQTIAGNQPECVWLPTLEVKDVQQSLCEVQKYVKLKRMLEGGPGCKHRKFETHDRDIQICEENYAHTRADEQDSRSVEHPVGARGDQSFP